MMGFAAVVFDLDGTLLDTLSDIAWSANHVLVQHGFAAHAKDDYLQLVGEGVQRLFWKALPEEARDDQTIERCCEAFRGVYAGHCNVETRPYQGVGELLGELQRRAIVMAVLSNKPHSATTQCVETYFAEAPFQIVLGQREGVPRKPDPVGALEIAEALAVRPEACAYLGDTGTDMQTAAAAGMYPVGALWGFRSKQELMENGARALIARPQELLRFFESGRRDDRMP
jgi:phosphoglycolate phosphatase